MRTRSRLRFIRSVSRVTMLVTVSTATAAAQVTSRVSVDSGGAQGNDHSRDPSISADGRYVAFGSDASNLVAGDTNGYDDIFVHDRQSGTTERVNVATSGAEADRHSWWPAISADGRYVAFVSAALNLVSGDTNGFTDIFVHDRQGGTTERVSVDSSGAEGNSGCWGNSISGDGRYVAFNSYATNFVAGDTNGFLDVFVRDRQTGTTERASVATGGAQGNGPSYWPSISADGRYVAFESGTSNLVAGDTNGWRDIFVHDRHSGTTELISVDSGGAQGNESSSFPAISSDGRYVAFQSDATNLVVGDTNGHTDVFLHDRQSGTTERVSVDSGGAQANYFSLYAFISADGRYVAFSSIATNLVAGDANGSSDVFVHDLQSGTTERVSVDTGGAQGDDSSGGGCLSADGRYVAFDSNASNLVAGDSNHAADIFVRDSEIGTTYCTANANSTGSSADISATGSASSALGALELTSAPVPNQNGIFFHGANPSQLPFGNGFLCTVGNITRGAVVMAAGNSSSYAYDNSDTQHSLQAFVGNTRHFQHWFRDPMGGGALFNTSNAVSILVEP